jgi:hypothetical protein
MVIVEQERKAIRTQDKLGSISVIEAIPRPSSLDTKIETIAAWGTVYAKTVKILKRTMGHFGSHRRTHGHCAPI